MKRLIGLDYGDKRIGVAISDPTRTIASPHSVIKHQGWGPTAKTVQALMLELDAEYVVLGLPSSMDGSESHQTRETLGFMGALQKLGIRVQTQDERLTSLEAEDSLLAGGLTWKESKALVDQVAAALILQAYLDAQRV